MGYAGLLWLKMKKDPRSGKQWTTVSFGNRAGIKVGSITGQLNFDYN